MDISEHEKPRIIAVLTAIKSGACGSVNRDDLERCQDLGLTDGLKLTKAGENYLLENV